MILISESRTRVIKSGVHLGNAGLDQTIGARHSPVAGFSGLNIGLQNGDAEMSGNSPGRAIV